MKLFCEDEKIAYYASAFGEIWSKHKGTGRWFQLKPRKTHNGYLTFTCCQNGKRRNIRFHRAVWEAFNGPIDQGLEVNHVNCVRDDNRLKNLELVTPSGNQNHPPSREHQREAHRFQMKPVIDVTTGIRYESIIEAARQTGLHPGNIYHCCNKKRYQTGGHVFRFAS